MTKEAEEGPGNPEYEVGYGKPPVNGQFKPGQSGNPKGHKRKPKSVQSQMQTILTKRITINEGGATKRIPLQEVMLRSIANKAAKGDLRAANFVLALINSDDAAQSETIDQVKLSAEDQALFEQMLQELPHTEATSDVNLDSDQPHQPETQNATKQEITQDDT